MEARPLQEGRDDLGGPAIHGDPADTTDEEREIGGRPRPPRGSGWWGAGRPSETRRKGLAWPVLDGGGLCSPGRWPLHRRNLPRIPLVNELRGALWKGYLDCATHFEKGGARKEFMRVACGQRSTFPFSAEKVRQRGRRFERRWQNGARRIVGPGHQTDRRLSRSGTSARWPTCVTTLIRHSQNLRREASMSDSRSVQSPAHRPCLSGRSSGDWVTSTHWPSRNGAQTTPQPTNTGSR